MDLSGEVFRLSVAGLAALLEVSKDVIERATETGRAVWGQYPVYEWAETDQHGDVRYYRVAADRISELGPPDGARLNPNGAEIGPSPEAAGGAPSPSPHNNPSDSMDTQQTNPQTEAPTERVTQATLAEELGTNTTKLSNAAKAGEPIEGYPVHEWVVLLNGQVQFYEVPADSDVWKPNEPQPEEAEQPAMFGRDAGGDGAPSGEVEDVFEELFASELMEELDRLQKHPLRVTISSVELRRYTHRPKQGDPYLADEVSRHSFSCTAQDFDLYVEPIDVVGEGIETDVYGVMFRGVNSPVSKTIFHCYGADVADQTADMVASVLRHRIRLSRAENWAHTELKMKEIAAEAFREVEERMGRLEIRKQGHAEGETFGLYDERDERFVTPSYFMRELYTPGPARE
jgi:hypothetical protein